jgi:hypothetical protein
VVEVPLPRPEPVGDEQDDGADDQEAADRQPRHVVVAVERGVDGVLEREADERGRNGGHDQEPAKASIAVVADPPLDDGPAHGPQQPKPVAPETVPAPGFSGS